MTGERVLTYNHTSDQFVFSTAEIPLYNCNSTYILRITAVTEDGRIITSNDVTITEDELKGYISKGQNGKLVMVNYSGNHSDVVCHKYRYCVFSNWTQTDRLPSF